MKKIAMTLLSCTWLGTVAGAIPTGYVTDGLAAYWDAIDNQASGTHDASATTWVDLVGRHSFQLTGTTWSEKYVQFSGTSTSYGALTGDDGLAIFDSSQAASKNLTVELVFKYDDKTSDGVILQAQTAAAISIGRFLNGTVVYYSSLSATDWTGLTPPKDEFFTIAAPYVSVNNVSWVRKGGTYHNAKIVSNWNTRACTGASDTQVTIGMTTAGGSCFAGRLYAIRVYSRRLSAAEVSQNYTADLLRYNYVPAGTVDSGSVTVGGVEFTAGETILTDPANTTLTLDAATDATILLDARITGVSHTNGTLSIANGADRRLRRIDTITLGEKATLQLPSDGLYVTGELTAEDGATVKGPGTLIGSEAQAPSGLTLTDGAKYLCATETSFAWPSSGIAYIPAGLTADIGSDDVAKVEGLDKIVFLGANSKVTYKISNAWTFGVPLEGPGTFLVESADLIRITGDNSRLTGGFFFTNAAVTVASRYGLGSLETASVKYYYGDLAGSLVFEGAGLTNDAPLWLSATNFSQYVLGPATPGETLVLSNDLRFAGSSPSFYFRNEVRVSGGTFGTVQAVGENAANTWLYGIDETARIWFDEGASVVARWLYLNRGEYHIGWSSSSNVNMIYGLLDAPTIILERDNVLETLYYGYGSGWSTLLDLNGHDQLLYFFDSSQQSAQLRNVTSACPATVRVWNRSKYGSMSAPVKFSGAASYTYAGPAPYTNTFTSAVSDSCGDLTVEAGTFRLASGAGWTGSNVVVRANARLIVDSTAAAAPFVATGKRPTTDLLVEKDGVIELLLTDEPVRIRTFTYNGTLLPAGSYTQSSGVGIEGPGTLRVRRSHKGKSGVAIILR